MTNGRRNERLPRFPRLCALPKPCVYRENGVCEDPRTGHANGDSACHRMIRWKVNEHLTKPNPEEP